MCGSPSNNTGWYSTNFSVNGSSYHKIYGKAWGYQRSTTDGFSQIAGVQSINSPYDDGLSITING